ncbi:MAG: DUF5063 domain-containing protein [Bifidobacteriaceae bacterium]|jgi:hypothetical protein|nr:DUF5063 domain-containing protein [Bifidobacteriaceae bacterium]
MSDQGQDQQQGQEESSRILRDAELIGEACRNCIEIFTDIAAGLAPEALLSLLAWATADASLTASRLAAVADFDSSPSEQPLDIEFDLDALRNSLVNALHGIDAYNELSDPRDDDVEVVEASLTDDILITVSGMRTGLYYLDHGDPAEALWWWQYTCFASWGERITSAQHIVQGLIAEARLAQDHERAQTLRAAHPADWEAAQDAVAGFIRHSVPRAWLHGRAAQGKSKKHGR